MTDSFTGVTLSETAAIVEYIINVYSESKLSVTPHAGSQRDADYLYWFHYANGTLQPETLNNMCFSFSQCPLDVEILEFARQPWTLRGSTSSHAF